MKLDGKIFEHEDYRGFVYNLQNVQRKFGYSTEWYNNVIDWIAAKPYDEAAYIIELLNDFYIAGVVDE